MDKINHIINLDNSRSHRTGLLPFVRQGNTEIEYVTSATTNGNYGHYVCDFVTYSGETVVERLKYLDIISRYNFIQECLRNAIYVKKGHDCSEGRRFVTDFEEIAYKSRYDFEPIDIKYFTKGKYGYYFSLSHTDNMAYEAALSIDKEERTDEQQKIITSIETASGQTSKEWCVLVPNYDDIAEISKWWNEVKPYGGGDNNIFTFCKDVEKYILGVIEVVSKNKDKLITGSKVPNYVYYTNHAELIGWFDAHKGEYEKYSANTPSDKEWVINEWNERGGNEFYEFLTKSFLVWQTKQLEGDTKYAPPTIDIETIINSEEEYETLYNVYEYSVSGNTIIDVVRDYELSASTSAFTINSGAPITSSLTPHFVEFDTPIYCESQLNTLVHHNAIMVSDGIFGVYKEFFDRNVENYEVVGQMFECTYCSGVSKTNYIEATYKQQKYSGNTLLSETIERKNQNEESPETKAYQVVNAKREFFSAWTVSARTATEEENGFKIIDIYTSAITQYKYEWWDCFANDNEPKDGCGDGEVLESGSDKYRNVTIVSCIDSLVESPNVGDKYYVLARYDNGNIEHGSVWAKGNIKTLNIPYVVGVPINKTTYSGGTIVHDVVESATISGDTLILKYIKGMTSGETETGVHYEETYNYRQNIKTRVPIDGYMAELYYDSLDESLNEEKIYSEEYKQYRTVKKAKITGMEVGTQWTASGAVDAMLFTKEGYEGLQEEPKENINLLFNRGNAAAWENHFKLSECNTMEDLENYGNNFFNL